MTWWGCADPWADLTLTTAAARLGQAPTLTGLHEFLRTYRELWADDATGARRREVRERVFHWLVGLKGLATTDVQAAWRIVFGYY